MNNDILKEFLRLYTQLPCGVIIFKDRSPYFINNHLRKILVLGAIEVQKGLEIIASIFGVEATPEALYTFLTTNTFFDYKTKHIQINYTNYEIYSIFVFTKIETAVLEEKQIVFEDIELLTQERTEEEADKEILEYFNKHHNVKTIGHVLYKGVPLISDNIVLKSYKNQLAVQIEKKQMISTQNGAKWVIKMSSGLTFRQK